MPRSVILIMASEYAGNKRPLALPPLNMLYLASFLKIKGIDVTIYDQQVDQTPPARLAEIVAERNPDLVGLTSYTPEIAHTLQMARAIKARTPEVPVVVGGAHVSATMGELFRHTDAIDFICYGEGEYTLEELARNIDNEEAWSQINGLIFPRRTNGRPRSPGCPGDVVVTPARAREPDLNSLPYLDFSTIHGFDIDKYGAPFVHGGRAIAIMASRGCPFRCSFCGQDLIHGRRVRFYAPGRLVAELQHHHDTLGVEHAQFKDSTFTVNKRWVREFCAELKAAGLGLHWGCNSRVDTIDEDLCRVMIDAGCTDVSIGIESGDQQTLDRMQKDTRVGPALETMKMMQKQDVIVRASYMIGNPGETQAQARKTVGFAVKANALLTSFNLTCAIPGTELYRQALARGELEDPQWYMKQDSGGDFYNPPLADGALEIEGLNACAELKRAYRKFYLRPSFFWHVARVVFRSPLFLKHCLYYGRRILFKRSLWQKARAIRLDDGREGFVDVNKVTPRRPASSSADG
jgi:anaerobic magnesium-protoporphyrin IX monomethyl ester cyclase